MHHRADAIARGFKTTQKKQVEDFHPLFLVQLEVRLITHMSNDTDNVIGYASLAMLLEHFATPLQQLRSNLERHLRMSDHVLHKFEDPAAVLPAFSQKYLEKHARRNNVRKLPGEIRRARNHTIVQYFVDDLTNFVVVLVQRRRAEKMRQP